MNQIAKFTINKNKYIEIIIPKSVNKQNYYYKPTDDLHMFDQITVNLVAGNTLTILIQDSSYEILNTFKASLEQVLNNERTFPSQIDSDHLGKYYNRTMYEQKFDLYDYDRLLLWSSSGPQTWLYNRNGSIYLEVIPTYLELFANSTAKLNDISFEEFMLNYKPILIEEIDRTTAQEWLAICNTMLNSMIKV
jgi:hypothetical protein